MVFIFLCQNHPEDLRSSGAGSKIMLNITCIMVWTCDLKRQFLLKWKLLLKYYNSLTSQLFNFWQVLEETNLALYPVNQTGLVRYMHVSCGAWFQKQCWHKDNARWEEVASRTQGIEVPIIIKCCYWPTPWNAQSTSSCYPFTCTPIFRLGGHIWGGKLIVHWWTQCSQQLETPYICLRLLWPISFQYQTPTPPTCGYVLHVQTSIIILFNVYWS